MLPGGGMMYPWLVSCWCICLSMGFPSWYQMARMPFEFLGLFVGLTLVVVNVIVVSVRFRSVCLFSPRRAPLYGVMFVMPFGAAMRYAVQLPISIWK